MSRVKRILTLSVVTVMLLFSSVVAVRNWWGERLLNEARAEQKRGNIRGAATLYKKALLCGKDEAAMALAKTAFYRRDLKTFRYYARKAIALNPLQGHVHILLAVADAAEIDDWGEAEVERVLDKCRSAVILEPRKGDLWRSYGDIALKIYREQVMTWPDAELRAKYRKEAAAAYRQALSYFEPRHRKPLVAFLEKNAPDRAFLVEAGARESPE